MTYAIKELSITTPCPPDDTFWTPPTTVVTFLVDLPRTKAERIIAEQRAVPFSQEIKGWRVDIEGVATSYRETDTLDTVEVHFAVTDACKQMVWTLIDEDAIVAWNEMAARAAAYMEENGIVL